MYQLTGSKPFLKILDRNFVQRSLCINDARFSSVLRKLCRVCIACTEKQLRAHQWSSQRGVVALSGQHRSYPRELLANMRFLHRLFMTQQIRNLMFPCRQRLSGWKISLASNWRSKQKRKEHFNSLL